jgi:DNA excision repair protein ERCC-2
VIKVAVTELAQFVHRRGDIHFRYDRYVAPADGVRGQRAVQRRRGGERYRREVTLSVTLDGEPPITLSGRADGVDESGDIPVIEEIKSTRTSLEALHAHAASVHWAQGMLYAHLYAHDCGCERVYVRLIYLHLDTMEECEHERLCDAATLAEFFHDTVRQYARWMEIEVRRGAARDASLCGLAFPMPTFRSGQRRLAEAVYRAVHVGGTLLSEAPTGIGKTLATLFPAVRALGAGRARRIFFLTARSTGARAACAAIAKLGEAGARLRRVELTAKAKICFNPDVRCDPAECVYARGFYDRVRPALEALLARDDLSAQAIAEVAGQHTVCPFELSLEAARWSDVIVGDLNYVFDPIVRISRLSDLRDTVLLVDEAHHLPERGREMFSTELGLALVEDALKETSGHVADVLSALERELVDLLEAGVCSDPRGVPPGLRRSLARFNALVEESTPGDHVLELWRATWRFERCLEWFDPKLFACLVRSDARLVKLHCIDAAPLIGPRLREARASVLFSATLSPFDFFRSELDVADAPALRLGSPFPPANLGTFVVTDVSTRWRDRAGSLGQVTQVIGETASARAGNYLVFLPSYVYLNDVRAELARVFPDLELDAQEQGMDREAQTRFLERFEHDCERSRVALAAMGGSFGESIDLVGDRLIGVIVVGVGLPPPSLERDLLQWHHRGRRHEARPRRADGYDYAYRYPGFVRVLQNAGRLIRSENDRGVLVLLDSRYGWSKYRGLFPSHWKVEDVPSESLGGAVSRFWNRM